MNPIELAPGIRWIGVNDRTTDLFEGLWPIVREGVSYNAYAVDDEKKVLVDLAKAFKTDDFLAQVNQVFDVAALDYVVINHTEPDHTGVLPILLRLAPKAQVLASPKGKEMLHDFYGCGDRVRAVADGETLSIGKRTLSFHHTPFLHWPDTMMTFDAADGVLFSCDAFGGYGALSGAIFDDEYADHEYYVAESLRYYANIVALFSPMVLKAIDKLAALGLGIRCVAPSHGLVWRKDPMEIVRLYKEWAEAFRDGGAPGVTLVYGSMYGNTERYMNAVAQGIAAEGLPVAIFDAARVHASYILPYALKYRALLFGVPTYEAGLFPPVAHALDILERKGLKGKLAGIFGSFLWSGGAQKEFRAYAEKLKWDVVESLEFRGGVLPADVERAFEYGRTFARTVRERATT